MTRFRACLAVYGTLLSLCLVGIAGAQAPPVPTLKANTKIVVIDVVVSDKQGQPVNDLKAADFALAENGAPQTISHFDEHRSLSAEDAAKVEAMPKLAPNMFTNYSPVPVNSAVNVLLFDSTNTHDRFNNKLMDQSVVQKQVLKYLAIPHPGVRMELFEQNVDLRLLQGFTSDQELLRAAFTNRKNTPPISKGFENPVCTNEETAGMVPDDSGMMASGMSECLKDELRDRSLNTLRAMETLARYMGGLPGRKNLLWFSTSFSIPQGSYYKEVSTKLHEVMALFARNQVVVYPIGAGGLMVTGSMNRSLTLNRMDGEKITMEEMAEDTGGKVYANTNDIAGAVDTAINDGSNYYTLTYTPVNRDWKGEFRKVQVKLVEKGYTLAYRPGYYADDAEKADGKRVVADAVAAAPDPARVALNAAMEYGSPQPSDVVLKVAVNPATGQPENTVAKLNVLAPKVSAPFERYVLSVAALPQAFTFTRDVPGKIHMAARLVTRVYSADGALVTSTTLDVIGDIDDARYQAIMADGVQFRQEISVPVKGESFLRIGVEDLATNRVGVVEVPVAMVAKLKPLLSADAVKK